MLRVNQIGPRLCDGFTRREWLRMGHTPKFNARQGRDHWGRVFSIALAGGGIKGGVVHGATDAHAAEPRGDIVRPCDYLATVFHCLGYGAETMVHDPQGRPFPISQGRVVEELLA